jgi:hypothetical protein
MVSKNRLTGPGLPILGRAFAEGGFAFEGGKVAAIGLVTAFREHQFLMELRWDVLARIQTNSFSGRECPIILAHSPR